MNSILITGTAKQKANLSDPHVISFNVAYDVQIWGQKSGEDLQLITAKKFDLPNYQTLWAEASKIAAKYFKDESFEDGGYTRFFDHLILL